MATIGEASLRSGVGIETIRYYERKGIVPKPGRSGNGRRVYSPSAIANLRFIKRCRDLGFPLHVASRLLVISMGERVNCGEVQNFGQAQLAETRSKIAELESLRTALEELVSNCEEGSTNCPMLEKLWSQ
jgi:MerR family mercuric resistance operon transcriptional regulator